MNQAEVSPTHGAVTKGPRRKIRRLVLRPLALIGAVLSAAVILSGASLLLLDEQLIVKVKGWARHSWVGTHVGSAVQAWTIETTLLRLKLAAYSVPVLDGRFQNGGGAILPRGRKVLIAERTGRFFELDLGQEPPAVRLLTIRLELNEDALVAHVQASGASIGPGRNVGMAGLGTRVHDLLALDEGRRLAASYTHWDVEQNCATLRVATIALPGDWSAASEGDWRIIFESRPCLFLRDDRSKPFSGHQAGGRLWLVGRDRLVVTVGDYKFDGVHAENYPQDLSADYGKLFEIDLRTGARRLISIGHRNPQGLTRDRRGRLWSTEHGPQGGDELNLIAEGRNYGWPLATLGTECRQCEWQRQGRHEGYDQPVFSWLPSIAVSNLIEVRDFAPEWDGDLLVASLKNQSLHRLRLEGDRVQYDESIFIGDRIRDIAQLDGDTILLWTDTAKLIKLSVDKEPSPAERRMSGLAPEVMNVLADCRQCHSFEERQNPGTMITLWGVFGRRIAAEDGRLFSPALRATTGYWDDTRLDRFLANPQGTVPGTTMQYGGIADPDLRREVIDVLKGLR
jgi:glucose/arabinose dehydrogenase